MLDARNPRSCAVHYVLTGHDGIESFGVDEEDGELTGDDNQGIVVLTCPYQMTQEQVEAVQNLLRYNLNDENGTAKYFAVKEYSRSIF